MEANTESFANIFTNGQHKDMDQFSDAVLKSKEGQMFNIHRMILAPKSDFFRAMFSFNNNSKEFPLKDIKSHILEQILIFLYTDQLSLKLEHIPDLLFAADFLLIDKLTTKCSSFAIKNLDVPNCLPLLNVAWHLNNEALFQNCYRFSQLYFQDIIENEDNNIGSLAMEVLKEFLAEHSLNNHSGEIIWDAINTWINYELAERLKFVPEMLAYLNIKNLEESIATNIITSAIVSKNEHCKAINELKSQDMSSHNILKHHMLLQCHPIFSIDQARLPLFLNVIVRKNTKTNIDLLITFDEKMDAYQTICNLDFFPIESLIIGNKLHLYRHSTITKIFSWDLVESKRTTISQALISRLPQYDNYAVISTGKIYYMKELFNNHRLSSVTAECYNPELDEWTLVAPMRTMYVEKIISCCDEVYAFGYIFTPIDFPDVGHTTDLLVQKYSPETDTWSLIALPSIERCGGEIARYNNKLLLIGGEIGDYGVYDLIDEYDPVTNSWSPMPRLPFLYNEPEVANVDNVLYIYDGESFLERDRVEPPVFWNEENQNWQIVTEASSLLKMKNFKFFTIHDPETVKRIIINRRCQKWTQSTLFK